MEVRYTAHSVNQAIEHGTKHRDSSKPHMKSDKFYVKVKDDKGQEYVIRYFF